MPMSPPSARLLILLAVLGCALLAPSELSPVAPRILEAQFTQEIVIESGIVHEPDLIIASGDNFWVTYVLDGQVKLALNPGPSSQFFDITSAALTHSAPTLSTSNVGQILLGYEREDSQPGSSGPEVFVQQGALSSLGPPLNLSSNAAADERPQVSRSAGGDRYVSWIQDNGGTSDLRFSENLGPSISVAEAEQFDQILDGSGQTVHWVYARAGELFTRSYDGQNLSVEIPVPAGPGPHSEPTLGLDPVGNVYFAYVAGGNIFTVRRTVLGAFSSPIPLTSSVTPSRRPQILVGTSGIRVLYEEVGDLWTISGAGIIFSNPVNATSTPGDDEVEPTVALDSQGILHAVYVRGDELVYRNDAPIPQPGFSPTSAEAEFPLSVSFSDNSSGPIDSWFWEFGDGETSTQQNPVHVYQSPGVYSVTLTVSGPGGTNSITVPDAIRVLDLVNFMSIPPVRVLVGQSDVWIPVHATNFSPIGGFQAIATWPTEVFEADEWSLANSVSFFLSPDFVSGSVDNDAGFAALFVLYDFAEPFTGLELPPSTNQRIANLRGAIKSSAPAGEAAFELTNDIPGLTNIFAVDGESVAPSLSAGPFTVVPFTFPPPVLFVRGDNDQNGLLEVTDAIQLLEFLFIGGPAPACLDTADVNDSGSIDVSDAIYLLEFLFVSGAIVPYPYPNPGLDPTADTLGDC